MDRVSWEESRREQVVLDFTICFEGSAPVLMVQYRSTTLFVILTSHISYRVAMVKLIRGSDSYFTPPNSTNSRVMKSPELGRNIYHLLQLWISVKIKCRQSSRLKMIPILTLLNWKLLKIFSKNRLRFIISNTGEYSILKVFQSVQTVACHNIYPRNQHDSNEYI